MSDNPPAYRSGFVAIAGRPNVGKSTLMNAFLGQKIAAISRRPQTTRRRQLGILTLENAQVIFIDTPGIHIARHKLGEYMNYDAATALNDADVVLWMVDCSVMPTEEDEIVARRIQELVEPAKVLLTLNKIDRIPTGQIAEYKIAYGYLLPQVQVVPISAINGVNLDGLLNAILERLPPGEQLYDPEQITDLYEREIAADLLREAALQHLREEVPHAVAVRIDEYTERGDSGAYIAATLIVEKESQKGIVIGRQGEMLKKISTTARQQIEQMSRRKVYLEVRVKVNKNWRSDPDALRLLGFAPKKNQTQ